MTSPLFPVEAVTAANQTLSAPFGQAISGSKVASFESLLLGGVERTNAKLLAADQLVKAFAVDDNIPVHQVTLALEEARLSLELMVQVRNRLVEGYQQIMNMQV